jgi:hypothetical protein
METGKVEVVRLGGKDLLAAVYDPTNQKKGYELAYSPEEGMTFSAYLEKLSPSAPGEKLDAYERLLQHCGIVLHNDPAKGVYAGRGDLFFQSNMPESRILFPEFINRNIRAAMIARGDFLSYLIAETEFSVNGLFRGIYLDDTKAQRHMGRIPEGGTPKIIKATWSEKAVRIGKFGIEVQMSYDFVRGASLPIISLLLSRVALTKALDELSEAVYVLVNGDGNTKEGTAGSTIKLSDMGAAAHTDSSDLDYPSYLKFLTQFYPYRATTIVGGLTDLVNFICMAKPSVDPVLLYALIDKSMTGGVPTIVDNPFGQISLVPFIDTTTLPANKFVAVDKTMALLCHRDVGVDLVETDRLIRGQFEQINITNKVGFSTIFAAATKQLDCTQ